jgi:hypothetical protein
MGAERQLEERCYDCQYPTIEAERDFKGEKLAVAVCINPTCDFYNWIVPEKIRDGDVDNPLFIESDEWAKAQAKQIKAEFLTRQPFVFTITPTNDDVSRYCEHKVSYTYTILRFMEWFRSQAPKSPYTKKEGE